MYVTWHKNNPALVCKTNMTLNASALETVGDNSHKYWTAEVYAVVNDGILESGKQVPPLYCVHLQVRK